MTIYFIILFISYFFAVVALLFCVAFVFGYVISAKGYQGPATDHFDGVKFFSIGVTEMKKNTEVEEGEDAKYASRSIIGWMLSRRKNVWVDRALSHAPVIPAQRVTGAEIIATYINHATVLIQTEGVNILTDPIWAKRASPVPFIGPRRYAPPGLALDQLPPIDIVLLSHNHYDHLDLQTLKKIAVTHNPLIFAHLGNAAYLASKGIDGAVDLDWGDTQSAGAVSIHSVPAQHFAARGIADRNKTLWGGFVIRALHGDIYFAGDTGLGPFVDRIVEVYPHGFRLAILPIGAFRPRFVMGEVHMSPDEALSVAKKIKAKQSLAIHFGTFKLADDKQDEPKNHLAELLKLPENKGVIFDAIDNGLAIRVS